MIVYVMRLPPIEAIIRKKKKKTGVDLDISTCKKGLLSTLFPRPLSSLLFNTE